MAKYLAPEAVYEVFNDMRATTGERYVLIVLNKVEPRPILTLVDGKTDVKVHFRPGEIWIKHNTGLKTAVQTSLSSSSIAAGQSVTINWKVLNAFSTTAQTCASFTQTGAGAWTGIQTGSVASGIYSGTATMKPAANGRFTYALTCGATQSNFATLTVSGSTQNATTIAASQSPSSVPAGSNVTLNAAVTSAIGIPDGSVQYFYGTSFIGQAALDSRGNAALTASTTGLPAGKYPIVAKYAGNSNYRA